MQLSFRIISKLCIFVILFTLVFFTIRFYNFLPGTTEKNDSIPWLFSAISVIFSIISGFVIQTKWEMWDKLIVSSQEELEILRHLFRMADHFSEESSHKIKQNIYTYLIVILKQSPKLDQGRRLSQNEFQEAVYALEGALLKATKRNPEAGDLGLMLRRAVKHQEYIMQNATHRLPFALRVLISFATFSIIFTSLFIGVANLVYYYLFTLIIGLLAYSIYLIIDDLDHPYRSGPWHLSMKPYREFLKEVKEKLAEL